MEVEAGTANQVFPGVDRVTPLIRGAADFTLTDPSVGQVVEVTGVANGEPEFGLRSIQLSAPVDNNGVPAQTIGSIYGPSYTPTAIGGRAARSIYAGGDTVTFFTNQTGTGPIFWSGASATANFTPDFIGAVSTTTPDQQPGALSTTDFDTSNRVLFGDTEVWGGLALNGSFAAFGTPWTRWVNAGQNAQAMTIQVDVTVNVMMNAGSFAEVAIDYFALPGAVSYTHLTLPTILLV